MFHFGSGPCSISELVVFHFGTMPCSIIGARILVNSCRHVDYLHSGVSPYGVSYESIGRRVGAGPIFGLHSAPTEFGFTCRARINACLTIRYPTPANH